MDNLQDLVTVSEAQRRYGISREMLHRLIRAGVIIPVARFGSATLIRPTDVLAYQASEKNKGGRPRKIIIPKC